MSDDLSNYNFCNKPSSYKFISMITEESVYYNEHENHEYFNLGRRFGKTLDLKLLQRLIKNKYRLHSFFARLEIWSKYSRAFPEELFYDIV